MRALRFDHVSISAPDVEDFTRFYESVFGMERLEDDVPQDDGSRSATLYHTRA